MDIIDLQNNKNNKDLLIDNLVKTLKEDKVLVLPTDTIYGLSAWCHSKKAIDKVFKIKKRPKNKTFILLISDLKMLEEYAIINNEQRDYLKKIWPGPITVILKAKKSISNISASDGTVAIRLPDSKLLQNIIAKLGSAIVSTSVNINKEKSLNNIENIKERFKNETKKPDLIIKNDLKNDSKNDKSSQIINLLDINNPLIVRK